MKQPVRAILERLLARVRQVPREQSRLAGARALRCVRARADVVDSLLALLQFATGS
jgi:hypothetical protein